MAPKRKAPTPAPVSTPQSLSTASSSSSLNGAIDPSLLNGRERADSSGGSGGDFISWLLLNADSLTDDDIMASAGLQGPMTPIDPIPVPQNVAAPQLPPSNPQLQASGSSGTDQSTQFQLNQMQQMLMMQQQMLMKISNVLPSMGSAPAPAAPTSRTTSPAPTPSTSEGAGESEGPAAPQLPRGVRGTKKPAVNEYETKLAALKTENEMLKRHLDSVQRKTSRVKDEKVASMEKMERIVKKFKSADENDPELKPEVLDAFIKKYTDMYSDYGEQRGAELTFHLRQLERLIMPTTTTKMGLWTLEQDDNFFSNTGRGSLAGILARELQISSSQMKKIIEHREQIKKITKNLKRTLALLGELKEICGRKHNVFKDRMEKVTVILEPVQIIKLLLWVNKNEEELKEVCPGWSSEQVIPMKNEKPNLNE